ENYPASPVTGKPIVGAEPGNESRGILAAGVAEQNGQLVSSGGRVLNVIGTGATLAEARKQAYETLQGIQLEGSHYRSDIALPAVEGRISI
ncbi:phosphoribosylglycinamide synthetase C domain-containing protein, partial [uncultured Corynebacterium sp.]